MNFHRFSLPMEYRDSKLPWVITILSAILMGILVNKYIDSLACTDELKIVMKDLEKEVNEIKKNRDDHAAKMKDTETWKTVVMTECKDDFGKRMKDLESKVEQIKKNIDEQVPKKQDLEVLKTVVMTECTGNVSIQVKEMEDRLSGSEQNYKNNLTKMQDLISMKEEQMHKLEDRVKPTRPVAFSAYAAQKQTSLKVHDTLVYDGVITNIGSAYNGETGRFRCPGDGDGVYFFTATTMAFPADEVETEIVLNGHPIPVKLYAGASKFRHDQGSNSVILQLRAGDLVHVRVNFVYPNVKSQMVKVWHFWSSFSGFRIY